MGMAETLLINSDLSTPLDEKIVDWKIKTPLFLGRKVEKFDPPAKLPSFDFLGFSQDINGCAVSANGEYLVCAVSNQPRCRIFKKSGSSYIQLQEPSVPMVLNDCCISDDGVYLCFSSGNASPYLALYKRSGDIYTKLPDPPTPAGPVTRCAMSADGIYLVVSHSNSPYFTVYKRNGDTFAKLSSPSSLPSSTGSSCSISANGEYIIIGVHDAPFMFVYRRSGDTLTKLNEPTVLPNNTVNTAAISRDGKYAIITTASGGAFIYRITENEVENLTFISLSIPRGCAASFDGSYFCISSSGEPLTILKRNGDEITKCAPIGGLYSATFALTFFPDGEQILYGGQLAQTSPRELLIVSGNPNVGLEYSQVGVEGSGYLTYLPPGVYRFEVDGEGHQTEVRTDYPLPLFPLRFNTSLRVSSTTPPDLMKSAGMVVLD